MKPEATALIVARPSDLRDSMRALLAASAKIAHISEADDGPEALAIIRQLCPRVAVLDCDTPALDLPTLLTRIKSDCPETKCLVLADNIEQQSEAQAAGADVTVLKGFPAARLVQTLSRLL